MPTNDITFSDMYKLFFNHEGYNSTKYVKDITVTEHITTMGDDDTYVAMPFNMCTDNCTVENISIDSIINSGNVDVTVYQNIVFMKFPDNDLILKYNSTAQANGSVNVGNMKCQGDDPFNFEFQLVGMFILTPPSHAFYIPNPSDPTFAIPNESIKASSILIYRSVCTPYIYIGTITNLEADEQHNPSIPSECLYQSILDGLTKIPYTRSKNSNIPMNKNKLNLQTILNKSDRNAPCKTESTNVSLKDLMPDHTNEFYTWLDPYHKEKLFWICYENRIKINSNVLDQFADAISDNLFWNTNFKNLNSRSFQMTKTIQGNYDLSPDISINPNRTNYSITSSVSGSKLTVDEVAKENSMNNRQDGLIDDICSSNNIESPTTDPVVVVNARGKDGDKMLIEVNKEGERVLGSGNGMNQDDIKNLQQSIDELKNNLNDKDGNKNISGTLSELQNKITTINNKSGGSTLSSVSTYVVWFFVIYLILTIIFALLVYFKFINKPKLSAVFFPAIAYFVTNENKTDIMADDIANKVRNNLSSNISSISNMRENIKTLLDKDSRTKEIDDLRQEKNSEIESLREQLKNKPVVPNTGSSTSSSTVDIENSNEIGLSELKKQLEQEAEENIQSGGSRINRKLKKAKIGYKRFRKSQL